MFQIEKNKTKPETSFLTITARIFSLLLGNSGMFWRFDKTSEETLIKKINDVNTLSGRILFTVLINFSPLSFPFVDAWQGSVLPRSGNLPWERWHAVSWRRRCLTACRGFSQQQSQRFAVSSSETSTSRATLPTRSQWTLATDRWQRRETEGEVTHVQPEQKVKKIKRWLKCLQHHSLHAEKMQGGY